MSKARRGGYDGREDQEMSATKDDERRALKKIVEIMEGLGSNSYVAMAFAGCVEIAEENIDNDWGYSMAQRCESAEKEARELKEKIQHMAHDVKALTSQISEANRKLDEKNDQIAGLNQTIDGIEEEKAKLTDQLTDQLIDESGYRAKAEQEIIKLKAKLYDLMMEGKA